MLWIEKYRPQSFDEMVGQEHVIARLKAAAGSIPHLLLSGPSGTGKSVAVECLSRELYGERQNENSTTIVVSDLFEQGKRYLEGDERYAHVYRRDVSLLSNFKNITRNFASIRPLDTDFRLLTFEGASALPREGQQALRRTMERYFRTCRFIFVTRRPSGIIPAISSRCLPFFFAPLPEDIVEQQLRFILRNEQAEALLSDDEIDLIVRAAGGDLRKAIMLLEVSAVPEGGAALASSFATESGQLARAALAAMTFRDAGTAIRSLENLIIEHGLTSREVLREFRQAVQKDYPDPRVVAAIAETDYFLTHSNNEYIQLNAMVARITKEVFS